MTFGHCVIVSRRFEGTLFFPKSRKPILWRSVTSHKNGTLSGTANKTLKLKHYNVGVLASGKSRAVVFWETCVFLGIIEYCLLLALIHFIIHSNMSELCSVEPYELNEPLSTRSKLTNTASSQISLPLESHISRTNRRITSTVRNHTGDRKISERKDKTSEF